MSYLRVTTAAVLMFVWGATLKAVQTTVKPVYVPPPAHKVFLPKAPASRPAAPSVGSGTRSSATPAAASRPSMSGIGRSTPVRPDDRVVRTKSGNEIHRSSNGQLREVHARGAEIFHGPAGSRTVIVERPNGVVVVANQHGNGYVQQAFTYNGTGFVQRTYSVNTVADARIYQRYAYYNKLYLDVYAPRAFYSPGFYGWAYNPWTAPVHYSWGWDGDPWYSYFASFFSPDPAYNSPYHWLTDYFLGQTLQDSFQERTAVPADGQIPGAEIGRAPSVPAPAPLTDEVKQNIAAEVRRQVALENSEAGSWTEHLPDPDSSGVARMLADDTPHVFVVSAPLNLASNGGECAVTAGDVLRLMSGTAPAATDASLTVLASKGADCTKGAAVTVGVADLQDMQNHMRGSIDQGLGHLQTEQGRNGIPAIPASALQPPVQPGWGQTAPPPAPDVTAELIKLTKEADMAESEALKTEPPPPVPAASLMGKSPDQVKAMLGKPDTIVDLGTQKFYVFGDRRVTFTHGKATDVQ